jgi:H+-transporting ATPase
MAITAEHTLNDIPPPPIFGDLHKNWGWLLGLGVLSLWLGSVGIFASFGMTLASILVFGVFIMAAGVLQLIQSFSSKGWKSILWHALIGFIYVALGFLVVIDPILTSVTFTLLIAAGLVVIGVLRGLTAFGMRPAGGWYWPLISGLISVALGVMIFAEWPLSGFWVIGLFVAVELIFAGWSYVFIALAARAAGAPGVVADSAKAASAASVTPTPIPSEAVAQTDGPAAPASSGPTNDLEKASLDEVLAKLVVKPDQGLTKAAAEQRLTQYGPNAIVEKEKSLAAKIAGYFMGPIAYMIEAAALVSALLGHWQDFAVIFALLIFNAALDLWQDLKASNALAALKKGLAPEATVLREGQWNTVDAATLVPGDIVKVRLGVIVPADLRLVAGDYAAIDQSALTGESIPATKKVGDAAYSGSVVKQGEMEGVVIATGANTFFGRTAKLVAGAGSVSHAQKAMFQIGNFLIVLAIILAAIMVAFRIYHDVVIADSWATKDLLTILQFVLVLLVASIPVAMPAVFSITMALGALALSKKEAIVSRLEAIEEMAGVDILCSDKTGTLTKNQLRLDAPILIVSQDAQEVILAGALASKLEDRDAIDTAVIEALKDQDALKNYTLVKYLPFDPVTKRTAATLTDAQGKELVVSKGAPQAIVDLVQPAPEIADKVKQTVAELAGKGYRALAVARSTDDGKTWTLLGILPMFDPPRDDSKQTIELARAKGVRVKMITGDDTAIARETARQLGMGDNILPASEVFPKDMDPNHVPPNIADAIEKADGFARVFPEHKYAIVKALQERGHLVAMTGDGVNDAPALKQADCGTAVSGATDAARGAAALILTAPGLSVINNAIDEARRIFGRITSYTIYRVGLTMDIMFLVVLSTIFLDFTPLTAIMIVVLSLLDDIPIMTIAYDNTQHLGRAWLLLGGAVVRSAPDRNGDPLRSGRAVVLRTLHPTRIAIDDVPPTGDRRASADLHHPQ